MAKQSDDEVSEALTRSYKASPEPEDPFMSG